MVILILSSYDTIICYTIQCDILRDWTNNNHNTIILMTFLYNTMRCTERARTAKLVGASQECQVIIFTDSVFSASEKPAKNTDVVYTDSENKAFVSDVKKMKGDDTFLSQVCYWCCYCYCYCFRGDVLIIVWLHWWCVLHFIVFFYFRLLFISVSISRVTPTPIFSPLTTLPLFLTTPSFHSPLTILLTTPLFSPLLACEYKRSGWPAQYLHHISDCLRGQCRSSHDRMPWLPHSRLVMVQILISMISMIL